MRILFLTDNFHPEVNAPASRTYEHCIEWVKQGAEVTVITCFPNFPNGKIFNGYKNKLFQRQKLEGINVIRVWSYITPNQGFFKRIIDFLSFAVMAFSVGLFQKCHVIVGTSPQFFTVVSARTLSFFKRVPWVMEVRDLWPESIVAVGAMQKDARILKMLYKLEKHLYKSAAKIIVVTNAFKKYIASLGINEEKISVVTNGVFRNSFSPVEKDQDLIEELGLQSKFLIGYIGTHGMAHALDFVLNVAKEIKDDHIHFIFQGDGAEKENLLQLSKVLDLHNVTFLPFVAKSEINRYISILDVALVNLKNNQTFKTVIPSKIFENASMLKPILLGVEGESKQIIEKYSAGVCFIPENEASFIAAIEEIQSPTKYKIYQRGCNVLANDFNRKKLASSMLVELQEVVKNP